MLTHLHIPEQVQSDIAIIHNIQTAQGTTYQKISFKVLRAYTQGARTLIVCINTKHIEKTGVLNLIQDLQNTLEDATIRLVEGIVHEA